MEQALTTILQERANVLARETGGSERQGKFTGASLAHTLIFSWQAHPEASLDQMASLAETAAVSVSETAVDKRFTPTCAAVVRRLVEEMSAVVVQAAEPVAVDRRRRFRAVILEDSSVLSLPSAWHEGWPGCGKQNTPEAASLNLHGRWELQRGRLDGPALPAGRVSDHDSPWYDAPLEAGALYVQDLGYFNLHRFQERRAGGAWRLSRLQVGTTVLDRQGPCLNLRQCAPKQVGPYKDLAVLVGSQLRLRLRLLLLRVPQAVAQPRRERLQAEAKGRGQTVSPETLALADSTLLIPAVPRSQLSLLEALVLVRERWQMELLSQLWKQDGQVDEWRTATPWRILCEVYAQLIGVLLHHWLIVVLAWHDPQRSLVTLAQVVRASGWTRMEALAGFRSLRSALPLMARRMRSGCRMNTRKQRPNSAQLLTDGIEWALSTA